MGEILLTSKLKGERLELAAGGSWTATHASELEALVDGVAGEAAKASNVSIDMAGVREFDTFGAWLLERLTREWTASGRETVILGLPEHDRGLLEEMHGVNRQPPIAIARENKIVAGLAAVGRAGAGVGRGLMVFADMLGALGVATVRMALRPREFRFTSTVHQLDRVAWQAVPIIMLITFLIGGIIAQQGIFHFRKFGAELYAVDLVGILILREIGVLIVAIMVAGRSGSSYTAELGSMKMRGDRRSAHHGVRSCRGAHPPAHHRADHRPSRAHLLGLDGGALRGRLGGLALWRHEPRHLHLAPDRGDLADPFQSGDDQGALHGAGHRRRGLL